MPTLARRIPRNDDHRGPLRELPAANTPVGSGVVVTLANGVTFFLASVTTAGQARVTAIPTGPAIPGGGFQLGDPAAFCDVSL